MRLPAESRLARLRFVSCWLACWGLSLPLGGVSAARESGAEASPSIHFAYAGRSTGFFSLGGQSTQVVRIPLGYRFRRSDKSAWIVRLRLPVSFGLHRFDVTTDSGSRLRLDLESLTFTPGVGLRHRLGRHWELQPFAEAGLGKQLSGEAEALIYRAGLRAVRLERRGDLEIRLGADIEIEAFRLLGRSRFRDRYGRIEVGADLRWPTGVEFRGSATNLSAYVVARRFVPRIALTPQPSGPLAIDAQWEVGLTVGADPQLSIAGLRVPRLGVGYQLGDGLRGFRFHFGFPF